MVLPYELPKFIIGAMTDEECDYIIDKAKPQLTFSTLSHNSHTNFDIRLSEECHLSMKDDRKLHDIISRHVEDIDKCEKIQVLKYKVGGFYKAHHDASEYQKNKRERTIIFGLNDGHDYMGGETYFPNINRGYKLRKGDALTFKNINPEGKILDEYLHGGSPLTSGEKWICTAWIRQEKLNDEETEDSLYSQDDYTFSQMTHEEVDEIVELEKEVYDIDRERPSGKAITKLINECPDLTLVVKHKGSIVGTMYGGLIKGIEITDEKINNLHDPSGDTLTIHSISVKNELRGKRLGDFIARYYYDEWLQKSKYDIKYYCVATRPKYTDWMKELGFSLIGPSKITYGTEYWLDFFKFAQVRRT